MDVEFNQTLLELSSVLIEKDLLARQSQVLEGIILSHEHISQWKEFVLEIPADFYAIFPFNFFISPLPKKMAYPSICIIWTSARMR
ncbi:MAG: hypothetical protein ACXV8Q_18230 [Methylobacter sp.]